MCSTDVVRAKRPSAAEGCSGMNSSDLTPVENKFLTMLHEAEQRGAADYISIIAVICAWTGKDFEGFAERYTRGDLKRAIKLIRETQEAHPEYADHYEAAVTFIREHWLHRKTVTA